MSRRVVDDGRGAHEAHGFLRGLVGAGGLQPDCRALRPRRARLGASKYNRFLGSLVIGMNGIVSFCRYPLHLISIGGMLLSVVRVPAGARLPVAKLVGVEFPTGNPTIVIVVCLFSGIQLLTLGIMGEYVGRIYDEVKQRPKFIVESGHGIDASERARRERVDRGDRHRRVRSRPVCILAGGLGTRLGERVRDTPKPLIEVAGRALPRSTSSRCCASTARSGSCSASATWASGSRRASATARAFGLESALPLRPAGARPAPPGAVRAALPRPRRALPRALRRHLPADRLPRGRARARAGHAGADDRARNDGRWDTQQRRSPRRAGRALRQARADAGHALDRLRALRADAAGARGRRGRPRRRLHPRSPRRAARGLRGDRALLRDRHRARRWPRPTRFSVEEPRPQHHEARRP